jgi:predicted O-linked N-acetylglucosamine transferase (SPINDLY family)
LSELIVDSLEAYELLALKLARDSALLSAMRQKLESNRRTHALFDTAGLCRHIESAFLTMSDILRSGEPPRGFAVPSI